MTRPRLQNYLRTYRRRFGLSQAEIGVLLGGVSGTKISRYENFTRLPAVKAIWAFETVFNRRSHELFAGSYEPICLQVRERAKHMLAHLTAQMPERQAPRLARKVEFLRAIAELNCDAPTARE